MRYRLKTLLIVLAVAGLLFAALRLAATKVRPSVVYGESAEFAELLADDRAIEDWLSTQPGVNRAFVTRESNTIRVTWIMSRDLLGNPPIPDLGRQFERFGYRGIARHTQSSEEG
jgi:hypothetical protein